MDSYSTAVDFKLPAYILGKEYRHASDQPVESNCTLAYA